MSQHKPPGMSNEQYLNELLAEHEKHKTLEGDARFPHSDRLLVAEIERVTAGSEALKVNANWKLHEVCYIPVAPKLAPPRSAHHAAMLTPTFCYYSTVDGNGGLECVVR